MSRRIPRRCRGFTHASPVSYDATVRGPRLALPKRMSGTGPGPKLRPGTHGVLGPSRATVRRLDAPTGTTDRSCRACWSCCSAPPSRSALLMFQVGKAAVLRSDAQTAADAAALAGAQEIQRQLMAQWATTGTTDLALINEPRRAAPGCAEYAAQERRALLVARSSTRRRRRQGDGHHRRGARRGREGASARRTPQGEAPRARAPDRSLTPSLGAGGSIGPRRCRRRRRQRRRSRRSPTRSGRRSKTKIGRRAAPDCDDMVALGLFLQEQGFIVRRERRLRRRRATPATRRRRLPLQVRRPRRARRQLRPPRATSSRRDRRRRPAHRAAARARLPHDLARGGPLQPPARRRPRLGGPIGARLRRRRRRLRRPARGRAAGGPADRLGGAGRAVLRPRRLSAAATSAARPTRRSARAICQWRAARRLERCCWRPSRRRSSSPASTACLRRPRLDRALPAAATRWGTLRRSGWTRDGDRGCSSTRAIRHVTQVPVSERGPARRRTCRSRAFPEYATTSAGARPLSLIARYCPMRPPL